MKQLWAVPLALGLAAALVMPSEAQRAISYPVDMSDFWNMDGFAAGNSDADDPFNPGEYGFNLGGPNMRVRSWTLPADFVDGQPNYTEDGLTQFLLGPVFEFGSLDSYRPIGDTIPAPEVRAFDRLYLALMSSHGEFPGSAWDGLDSMTVNYADGTTEDISIGVVNDWFWSPPQWFAPASGDPNEIVVNFICYDGDADEWDYVWDWVGGDPNNHNYGQHRFFNGPEEYIIYRLPYTDGADLYLEFWGNIIVEISVDDPSSDFFFEFPMETLYNSVEEEGEIYPYGGDGFEPNRDRHSFDLSEYLPAGTNEYYLRIRDAAPGQAGDGGHWGGRIHRIGMFTGEVVLVSTGERLFPNLVRTVDGASPPDGVILIRKTYRLDNEKAVESLTMPDLRPEAHPLLSLFGITYGVLTDDVGVIDFDIYE